MTTKFAVAAILLTLASPVWAQSDSPHSDQDQNMTAVGVMPSQGMMMGVMGQEMMMRCPMMGIAGNPHTEGRIAFLKAELKITSSQENAWSAYADTVRALEKEEAGKNNGMMTGRGMMHRPGMLQQDDVSAPEALKARIEFMERHLKDLKKLQSATSKLYARLNNSQQKSADELLGKRCAMALH